MRNKQQHLVTVQPTPTLISAPVTVAIIDDSYMEGVDRGSDALNDNLRRLKLRVSLVVAFFKARKREETLDFERSDPICRWEVKVSKDPQASVLVLGWVCEYWKADPSYSNAGRDPSLCDVVALRKSTEFLFTELCNKFPEFKIFLDTFQEAGRF